MEMAKGEVVSLLATSPFGVVMVRPRMLLSRV